MKEVFIALLVLLAFLMSGKLGLYFKKLLGKRRLPVPKNLLGQKGRVRLSDDYKDEDIIRLARELSHNDTVIVDMLTLASEDLPSFWRQYHELDYYGDINVRKTFDAIPSLYYKTDEFKLFDLFFVLMANQSRYLGWADSHGQNIQEYLNSELTHRGVNEFDWSFLNLEGDWDLHHSPDQYLQVISMLLGMYGLMLADIRSDDVYCFALIDKSDFYKISDIPFVHERFEVPDNFEQTASRILRQWHH